MKLILFLVILSPALASRASYDGFQVFRVTPKTLEGAEFLKSLEDNPLGYDFWTSVKGPGHPVDVMVPPNLKLRFEDLLGSGQFDSELFVEDVQKLIDGEQPKVRGFKAAGELGWTEYHTLDEINAWLRSLAASDSRVTLINGGRSYQGRDILGVRVSFAEGNQNRSVFLEANIHAREWITSAVATYFLNELLTSTDRNIRQVADSHDWYIFPVFNPDGFVYSHTTDRMWRKTRVPYTFCYGADPNRNWGFHFNEGGSSSNPCSETYNGPQAFSEPSTKSLSNYISTIGSSLQAYISLHSYSQLLLLPYGYSSAHLDNYQDLYNVGVKAASSLAQRYNTQYRVGNIVEVLYVASGGSMDWAKGTFRTPITYTYELRDTGRYGFILPANQILPTSLETVDSLITIFQEFDKIL